MTAPVRVLELRSVRGTGGGPEKTILLGAARSQKAGFDITVCYLRDGRDRQFAIGDWARELGVHYVEIAERHSLDTGAWRKLRQLIREARIQIVHAHEYKTDLLAWLLAKREPVIPLATVHGWTGHTRRERLLYYPADKRLLRTFPRLIAVSSDIRDELVAHGADPNRVTVLLNSIDPKAFCRDPTRQQAARAALDLRVDEVVVGSVGRLEPQKRFDLLIEAAAALHREFPGMRLLIAGEGSERAALEARCARLELGDVVRFLGLRTDVPFLHHAFDLYVQSSDYEGTPNAVLEAMALETPVVATDAGGTREIVRDGIDGLIVGRGNARVIADGIRRALADGASAKARARSARERVEQELSFDTRVRAVESIYREMVAGQGR